MNAQPAKPLVIMLNNRPFGGTYWVTDGKVHVDSAFGAASACAVHEGHYATAISLFFNILANARARGTLSER